MATAISSVSGVLAPDQQARLLEATSTAELGFESQPSCGSTFWVDLPCGGTR